MIWRREDSILALREKKDREAQLAAKVENLEEQLTEAQLAMCDMYEQLISLQSAQPTAMNTTRSRKATVTT